MHTLMAGASVSLSNDKFVIYVVSQRMQSYRYHYLSEVWSRQNP